MDDAPIVAAGGFLVPESAEGIITELSDFRSKEGDKLFPPQGKNYGVIPMAFQKELVKEKMVHYSRTPESWSDIILRKPILTPNSAILSEYWVKKPNIIEE